MTMAQTHSTMILGDTVFPLHDRMIIQGKTDHGSLACPK